MCKQCQKINGMKKTRRRRASVRGFSGKGAIGELEQVALITAGAIGAAYLKDKVDYLADPAHKTIAGGILAAAGIALSLGVKNPMAKSIGTGVAINGVVTLANSFMPAGQSLPAIGGVSGIGLYPGLPHRSGIAGDMGSGRKIRLA